MIRTMVIVITLVFLVNTVNLLNAAGGRAAPSRPAKGPSLKPGMGGSMSEAPDELTINWQAEDITSTINIAAPLKKVIFIYFYFDIAKEQFPSNYDVKLQKYSQERYVFAKIWVSTNIDKKGKTYIVNPAIASFFDKNKLSFTTIAVALDPYGNLMDKLSPPMRANAIIAFLDAAERKFIDIQADLDRRYEKAEKLLKDAEKASGKDKENTRTKAILDAIKTLQGIIKTPYEGNETAKKSSDRLDSINEKGKGEYSGLLKGYASLEKELQDTASIVPELEKVINIYKGLPVEQEIKDAIKDVKEGKIPERILKEIEQEKEQQKNEPGK